MPKKIIPDESLIQLKYQLDLLSARSPERKRLVSECAELYGVSVNTVYRSLREKGSLRALRRSDKGNPRILLPDELKKYCQIIAAMKIRTRNKKGRSLPTTEALRLLEDFGIETPSGLVKPQKGLLKKSTINRYLKSWGYDQASLGFQQVVTRFQAKHSNECWHFDLSPSDLKYLPEVPEWIDPDEGKPILMLYSVVDDRSRVAYQEYHVVYGEDVESALRFFFRAMSPKDIEGFPFQGRPHMIYTDNGAIARSGIFNRVMSCLDIAVRCHLPSTKAKRKVAARAKGKVERPFRTVKELHETLYHFHKPQNIQEANEWLINYVLRYNERNLENRDVSRIQDWIDTIPQAGLRKMCSWERFCRFTREPEKRKVGPDAHVSIGGIIYEVDHHLSGEEVIIWWGLFDNAVFVELNEEKYGPYEPVSGPIPLHKYRAFKKTLKEKRAEEIEELASKIALPIEAFTKDARAADALARTLPENIVLTDFKDPDPFNELLFPNTLSAKRAISNFIGIPLAKLNEVELACIEEILTTTLDKQRVFQMVRERIMHKKAEERMKESSYDS